VCGRGHSGFYCALSSGGNFVDTNAVYLPEFNDPNGWNTEAHYRDLWFIRWGGGPLRAICGRGWEGIYCAYLNSAAPISFTPASLLVKNFGDLDQWGSSPSYWATVQPAGPIGPSLDFGFCGRGDAGILCSTYRLFNP
jgi:hypothetical protein